MAAVATPRGAGGRTRRSHRRRTFALNATPPHAHVAAALPTLVHLGASEHAGGTLQLLRLEGCGLATWTSDRLVRVWQPHGFDAKRPPPGGWPVMWLMDGQNLFDDEAVFTGHSWRAGLAAAEAIRAGKVPPCVLVGVDHGGVQRSMDYLPFPPGEGEGGIRPEAAGWPGGGAEPFCDWLVQELMPVLQAEYGLANHTAPERVAFGGSSFGGMVGVYMSMRYPAVFGTMVILSCSFWAAKGALLQTVEAYEGEWPASLFVGFGRREYTGTRHNGRGDVDDLLVSYIERFVGLLRDKGVGGDRLEYVLEDTAHTESDWAKTFPRALMHAFGPLVTKAQAATNSVALHDAERERLGREMKGTFFFTLPGEMVAGQTATVYCNASRSEALRGQRDLTLHSGYNGWTVKGESVPMGPSDIPSYDGAEWWSATFAVPEGAKQMNFVFSAGGDRWENNSGDDYLITLTDPELKRPIPAEKVAELDAEAERIWAQKHGADFVFTVPSPIQAGQPVGIYVNPKRSVQLSDKHPVVCFGGYNGWGNGNFEAVMEEAPLPQYDDIRWQTLKVNVPKDAFDLQLAFADTEKQVFDNNDDNDYSLAVATQVKRKPRTIADIESYDHAGGKLELVRLNSRPGTSRRAKWKEERLLRVWTPAGYDRAAVPEGGIPVLVMNDGKNLFEDWLAHQGVSWNIGHCAADLIGRKVLPPFIIVGIDSPGPFRSQCYLPFPPGIGAHSHRPDAERWPGGDVESYMARVVEEVLPLVATQWGGSLDRERLAFGGSSFGGVCALFAGMHYPHVFSSVLAESPSIWSAEGRFLGDMEAHEGGWPDRTFIGTGTREYSATRDHDWDQIDQLLLHYSQEAVRIMECKGVHQHDGRLAFQVEEGAGHIEGAWGGRLHGSLQYLCQHWWGTGLQ